jgi:hypothetical protein
VSTPNATKNPSEVRPTGDPREPALVLLSRPQAFRARPVGRSRVVALATFVACLVIVLRAGAAYGPGVAVATAWVVPAVILATVLVFERILLRGAR